MKKFGLPALLFVIAAVSGAYAQQFPDKINGYKVYSANIVVTTADRSTASTEKVDATVTIGKLKLGMPGLLSVGVEAGGEFTSISQEGKVDFLQFRDMQVNGIAIDVQDFKTPFEIKKGRLTPLPANIRGNIGLTGVAKAAYKELTESKDIWNVTGTVLVFGRFKKYGFEFKRVVPIKVDLTMSNPLR